MHTLNSILQASDRVTDLPEFLGHKSNYVQCFNHAHLCFIFQQNPNDFADDFYDSENISSLHFLVWSNYIEPNQTQSYLAWHYSDPACLESLSYKLSNLAPE